METISRKEAKLKGLTKYFTGKPCKNGHSAYRKIDGGCSECGRIKTRSLRSKNPLKYKEQTRKDTLAHPARNTISLIPEHERKNIKPMSLVCDICGNSEKSIGTGGHVKNLSLDHDKITGKPRGWLCNNHNRGIGFLDHSPLVLRKAAEYLESFEPDTQACY